MIAVFDTSVLLASLLASHPHHARAMTGGLYTFNVDDFRRVAPDLVSIIVAP